MMLPRPCSHPSIYMFTVSESNAISDQQNYPTYYIQLMESINAKNVKQDMDNSRLHQGWILGNNGELLFWVPPSHRNALYWPRNTLVIGENSTRLDLCNFVHGLSWIQCQSK